MADDDADTGLGDVLIAMGRGLFDSAADDAPNPKKLLDAIAENDYIVLTRETARTIQRLLTEETPADPDLIHELDKDELVFHTIRANLFEKLRLPGLSTDQLEALHGRTQELWGEYPTEPRGRWVEWTLWTIIHRRENGIPIAELVAGSRTAEEVIDAWAQRHEDREDQRRLRKMANYNRYETPDEVPPGLKQLLMSPFLGRKASDVSVEIEEGDSELQAVRIERDDED